MPNVLTIYSTNPALSGIYIRINNHITLAVPHFSIEISIPKGASPPLVLADALDRLVSGAGLPSLLIQPPELDGRVLLRTSFVTQVSQPSILRAAQFLEDLDKNATAVGQILAEANRVHSFRCVDLF